MRNLVLASALAFGGLAAAASAPASAADVYVGFGIEDGGYQTVRDRGWRDGGWDDRGWDRRDRDWDRGDRGWRGRPYRPYRAYYDYPRYRPAPPRVRYQRDCEIRRYWNGYDYVKRRVCY